MSFQFLPPASLMPQPQVVKSTAKNRKTNPRFDAETSRHQPRTVQPGRLKVQLGNVRSAARLAPITQTLRIRQPMRQPVRYRETPAAFQLSQHDYHLKNSFLIIMLTTIIIFICCNKQYLHSMYRHYYNVEVIKSR